MILALLLLTSPPIGPTLSGFVEESHEADWRLLYEAPEGEIWIDEEWSTLTEIDGTLYPTSLLRLIDQSMAEASFGDILVAIDCDESRFATVQLMGEKPIGNPVSFEPQTVQFNVTAELIPVEILEVICEGKD